ncbi:MAG: alpha/beta fold hydrolase [Hyphomicrobiaceae bacterium]
MQNWNDIYYTAQDGLRLHARFYPGPLTTRRAALCLPSFTGNSREFHALASALSSPENPTARSVLTVDYRGRGHSDFDRNWRNYTLQNELYDALDLLTIAGFSEVAVVGTSRGGLIAMLMACLRPAALGAVVLNDIGPIIEREGLIRHIAYVGRIPVPPTWEDATALVRNINRKFFPAIPDEQWPAIARQWFNDDHNRPSKAYDPHIARMLAVLDTPNVDLWPQFNAFSGRPAMAIRGSLSDILSEKTFNEMRARMPSLVTHTVRDQGHAPLLRDRSTILAINDFLASADNRQDHDADDDRYAAA